MFHRGQQQDDQQKIRRHMLNCVKSEQAKLVALVDAFSEQGRRDQTHCVEILEKIVGAVDKIMLAGDWGASPFLRNTIKPLEALRDQTQQLLQQFGSGAVRPKMQRPAIKEGMKAVYISIFQTSGHDLSRWSMQLKSLSKYVLGRPIYLEEEYIKKMIRAKMVQTSEAYVMVAVPESSIQVSVSVREDRHGSPLTSLADGVVKSENILEFVHQEKRYYFVKDQLILQD